MEQIAIMEQIAEVEQVSDSDNRLEQIVAVLIALVTVIGALVAWRAAVIADAAGDADFAGVQASLNAGETRALNFVNAYEHYGTYTNYLRYNELGNELNKELEHPESLSEEQVFLLNRQRAEAYDLAKANQEIFPNRFLSRDGSYSVEREMGESWADAAKQKDLNPDSQYAEADTMRAKSNAMLGTLVFLGLALVFFTLVETLSGRLALSMVALGGIFSLIGTVGALYLEFAAG